jgi:hypothetical protein
MFKIKVERVVKASIENVSEAISDHASYALYPSVGIASLLSEGDEERNGKGALRTVETGVFKVWERITEFKRPVHMEYKVERAKPIKMDHDKGIIDLKDLGDGTTHVTWVSEGRMAVPLIGRFFDSKMQKQGASVFHSMLKSIELR